MDWTQWQVSQVAGARDMASFFPLISEILPMIMPATTHVARARDIEPRHPTDEGPVVVRTAVVDKCDGMSATGASPVRHIALLPFAPY